MPKLPKLRHGFEKRLEGTSFEQAIDKTTAALKAEGFGILTRIDVKDTLKKKLDIDFRRYVILGACNPALAHQGLSVEEQIGLLLPCNVVVQEAGEAVVVSISNPKAIFELIGNPALAPVADDAHARLQRAMDAIH